MKGVLFYNLDLGKGGPRGYVAHFQKWCVDIDGRKIHISHELTEEGRKVSAKECDGSCQELVEIESTVARLAVVQVEAVDRHITPAERYELPPECRHVELVSELKEVCRGLLGDLNTATREATAGRELCESLESHALRWTLRKHIAEYKRAAQ